MSNVKGKVVVITGASSGIGESTGSIACTAWSTCSYWS